MGKVLSYRCHPNVSDEVAAIKGQTFKTTNVLGNALQGDVSDLGMI
jgi:hypothetical protein